MAQFYIRVPANKLLAWPGAVTKSMAAIGKAGVKPEGEAKVKVEEETGVRLAFGSRQLKDPDKVFVHNAW